MGIALAALPMHTRRLVTGTLLLFPASGLAAPLDGSCVEPGASPVRVIAEALAAAAAPDLPNTPNPAVFASAWTRRFEEAVTRAAARDGRLSRSEAKRISEREGFESLFSDDALAILSSTGQQTISIARIVELAHARALASATTAAGADGRLSLADGTKLRTTLRADFQWLRGKGGPGSGRTDAQLTADVRAEAERALLFSTARKLAGPPASVMGRNPIVDRIDHPSSKTWASVWMANGQIYLSRASSSPSPLVGWYHVGAVPTAEIAAARAKVADEIGSATSGLWLTSERDAKVVFLNAGPIASGAGIGPDTIETRFAAAHDAITTDIYDAQGDMTVGPLAGRAVEERGVADWFDGVTTSFDPADPVSVERAAKWQALRDAVDANLTDVHLYRFTGGAAVSIFVVGRTANGDLAGVLTAAIET